jgi:hypothetical protein
MRLLKEHNKSEPIFLAMPPVRLTIAKIEVNF